MWRSRFRWADRVKEWNGSRWCLPPTLQATAVPLRVVQRNGHSQLCINCTLRASQVSLMHNYSMRPKACFITVVFLNVLLLRSEKALPQWSRKTISLSTWPALRGVVQSLCIHLWYKHSSSAPLLTSSHTSCARRGARGETTNQEAVTSGQL